MNYEQKYKEALKIIESLHNVVKCQSSSDALLTSQTIEKAFPELKENEDEQHRKWILEYLYDGLRKSDEQFKGQFKCAIAWLEKQGAPEDKGEISDGYHTFNELYYYRMLYNAAFFNMLPKEWVHKSKKHNDGEECFGGGWFIVMANLPTGQISNHYELKDWNLFQIPEKEVADKWDGHTPQEAADRLHKYLLEKQGKKGTDPRYENEKEEFTEFEKMLRYVLECYSGYEFASKSEIETLKLNAKSLLDLAKKELQPEFDKDMDKMLAETDKIVYQKGQQDALKSLPRWKKVPKTWKVEDNQKVVFSEDYKYYINKRELFNKLPKEE